ncbi:hypothetical protein ACQR2W_00065 [Clostridium perfringens]
MNINKDIFECAANGLNLSELRIILEEYNINFQTKDKKHEIIDKLINLIDKKEMKEELYLAIKTKAFSDNNNCNEGFYYKYPDDNIEFIYDKFKKILEEKMESEEKSKHGTNIFKYSKLGLQHEENKKIITFVFKRETKSKKYDYIENDVKILNEILKVNVEINYEASLVYIQSKNYNKCKAVKFFLEKVINELRVDKSGSKIRLAIPKFDDQIVGKWASEEKVDIRGISSMTIHMLDLLSEFKIEDNKFTNYCMKKIYFGDDVVDAGKKNKIEESIFRGNDIEDCIEIAEGILKGKKINGFELSVEYLYGDEEYGEDVEVVQVPISILQEQSSTVRISISKDLVTVDEEILKEIYQSLKNVFIKKIKMDKIRNTENIKEIINQAKEILVNQGEVAESKKGEAKIII